MVTALLYIASVCFLGHIGRATEVTSPIFRQKTQTDVLSTRCRIHSNKHTCSNKYTSLILGSDRDYQKLSNGGFQLKIGPLLAKRMLKHCWKALGKLYNSIHLYKHTVHILE